MYVRPVEWTDLAQTHIGCRHARISKIYCRLRLAKGIRRYSAATRLRCGKIIHHNTYILLKISDQLKLSKIHDCVIVEFSITSGVRRGEFCKLGKEHLNALICKFYTFSRQNSDTLNICTPFPSKAQIPLRRLCDKVRDKFPTKSQTCRRHKS